MCNEFPLKKTIQNYLANKLKSHLVTAVGNCCCSFLEGGLGGDPPQPEASSAQARGLLLACSQLEAGFLRDPILLQGVLQQEHREGTSEMQTKGEASRTVPQPACTLGLGWALIPFICWIYPSPAPGCCFWHRKSSSPQGGHGR